MNQWINDDSYDLNWYLCIFMYSMMFQIDAWWIDASNITESEQTCIILIFEKAVTCSHLQQLVATCRHMPSWKKSDFVDFTFFQDCLSSHNQPQPATCSHLPAATCSHMQPLAAPCSLLQPLAATCSHLQPLAATGKWLQVAAFLKIKLRTSCTHNAISSNAF